MNRKHVLHGVCGAGVGSMVALAMRVAGLSGGGSDRWLRIWATMTLPGLALTGAIVGVINPLLTAQLRDPNQFTIEELKRLGEDLNGTNKALAGSALVDPE